MIEHIKKFHISHQQLQKALVEENYSETEEEISPDDGERDTIESIQKSEYDPKILSNEKIFLKNFPVLGNHRCQTCGKSYMHYAKLDRHIKTVHMGIKKEFIWTCKLCNKIYSTAKTLEIHTKSMHEGKKFNCDSCSKSFTQKSYLKKHVKIVHEGIELFKCASCHKSFTQGHSLQSHFRIVHEGRKLLYECDFCEKSFITPSN